MLGQPHVDAEALCCFSNAELDSFDKGRGALLWNHGAGVGCWVAGKLVRHDDEVAFCGVLVGLELVVCAVDARSACEQ